MAQSPSLVVYVDPHLQDILGWQCKTVIVNSFLLGFSEGRVAGSEYGEYNRSIHQVKRKIRRLLEVISSFAGDC